MPRISTAFRVRGIEPADPLFAAGGEALRRAFWRAAVGFVLRAKDASLAKGLDRHGFKLRPVTFLTRKNRRSEMGEADPDAPPLTPAYGLSRTRAFLKGRAFAGHAEFFWTGGWGRILHFHRVGAKNRWSKTGRLPRRDVIGLSQADENVVKREAAAWWRDWKRAHPAAPVPATRPLAPQTTTPPAPVPAPSILPGRRGRVVVLPDGVKPTRPSNRIQVYTDNPARAQAPPVRPPGPPARAPAPKPVQAQTPAPLPKPPPPPSLSAPMLPRAVPVVATAKPPAAPPLVLAPPAPVTVRARLASGVKAAAVKLGAFFRKFKVF